MAKSQKEIEKNAFRKACAESNYDVVAYSYSIITDNLKIILSDIDHESKEAPSSMELGKGASIKVYAGGQPEAGINRD